METKAKDSRILQKSLELCQAITQEPDFASLKAQLDAFLADESLKFQYQQLNEMGRMLQMKQGAGEELSPEETSQFETVREELVGNPIAQGFFEAQQQLQQLHQFVGRVLDKTFELGQAPTYEDVHDGSCGNCDCH